MSTVVSGSVGAVGDRAAGRTRDVRLLVARLLLGLAAVGATAAAVSAWSGVGRLPGELVVGSLWQSYALLTFAGLFVVLAVRPRRNAAVWVLVTADKLALTVTGVVLQVGGASRGLPGARDLLVWDGPLTVVLLVALGCAVGRPGLPRRTAR